jgi:hypothetical protein
VPAPTSHAFYLQQGAHINLLPILPYFTLIWKIQEKWNYEWESHKIPIVFQDGWFLMKTCGLYFY